jgi:hypothetical protein
MATLSGPDGEARIGGAGVRQPSGRAGYALAGLLELVGTDSDPGEPANPTSGLSRTRCVLPPSGRTSSLKRYGEGAA